MMEELQQRLEQHDHHFHRLIQLIPHELYKHTASLTGYHDDSENEEQVNDAANSKYYKHRKQPLTADERKIKSIENKKRKYSSENAVRISSLLPHNCIKYVHQANERNTLNSENKESHHSSSTAEQIEPDQKKQKIDTVSNSTTGDKMEELRKKLQVIIRNGQLPGFS